MPFSPEGLSEVLRGTVSGLESVREPGLCGLKLPARDFEGERLSLRLPLLGDREPEHESPFRAVRHFDSAAVEKYGVAYERQAESGASRPARTPLVDPVETFEETIQMFGRYSNTCVGKAEIVEILIFTETVDIDLDITSGVCDGIVH